MHGVIHMAIKHDDELNQIIYLQDFYIFTWGRIITLHKLWKVTEVYYETHNSSSTMQKCITKKVKR